MGMVDFNVHVIYPFNQNKGKYFVSLILFIKKQINDEFVIKRTIKSNHHILCYNLKDWIQ